MGILANGLFGPNKSPFHRKAFLLVLNTIHRREILNLYLYRVLSITRDRPFPLG